MRHRSRRLAGLGFALLAAGLWTLATPSAAQAGGRHGHGHHRHGGHFRWHGGHQGHHHGPGCGHGSSFSFRSGFPLGWSGHPHHNPGVVWVSPFYCGVCHHSFAVEHDFHQHLHHHHFVDFDLIPSVVVETGFGFVFVD